jgi:predicted nucleic acid-binding protein
MTTKKDLLIHMYQYLKTELEVYIDGSLFPSLDDYDITDIIFYLNLYFPKGGEQEYINTIEKLMKQKQIDINDDDFTTVVNLIIDFINFLNNL